MADVVCLCSVQWQVMLMNTARYDNYLANYVKNVKNNVKIFSVYYN